jgi:hypothetical protein
MKKIKLTQNKFAIVDDDDYKELNQYNWCAYKGRYTHYVVRGSNKLGKNIPIHRQIMNPPDNMQVDHINGNGLDNRKENLRICKISQNIFNGKLRKNNTSGFKGVTYDKKNKKWYSQITVNRKHKFLGRFTDINDAKESYIKAAKDYFGEFYTDGITKEDKKLQKEIDGIKLIKKERLQINNTSGIEGVYYHKRDKNWFSQIYSDKKHIHLGSFACIADAKAAYDVATMGVL